MYKYEEQFRAENPQTIGEIDRQFDLDNYKDWLEKKLGMALSENVKSAEIEFEDFYDGESIKLIEE